jgi:hypothetical protein
MSKPDSNLPPQSQTWRRYQEQQDDTNAAAIANILAELDRLSNSDGGMAALYAQLMVGPIGTLQDQLKTLYTLTGNVYPPVASGPAPPPATPSYTVIETGATWSRTWGSYTGAPYAGGGTYTDSQMLYQGSSENKIGLWGIDMGSAYGKNIIDMQVFLQNSQYPYSSGGIAGFGTHQYGSPPSGKPGRSNGFDVGWAEGQGKYASIPPVFYGGFSNGTFKGLSVGGFGANNPQSAIFHGVGKPFSPRLRITYQV